MTRITPHVTMQELDARVAKIAEQARHEPVVVNRYGSPWICLVGYNLWAKANQLSLLVPKGHPLVSLRKIVEDVLGFEHYDLMKELAGSIRVSRGVGDELDVQQVEMLVKSLILRVVYSLESEEKVHEVLLYNMACRWFVGLERFSDEPPPVDVFAHDLHIVTNDARAAELAFHCLEHAHLLEPEHSEFKVNRAFFRR